LAQVPCRWAGLDLIARVGTGIVHNRKRFGERSIDYRHYLPELARKPQAVRQTESSPKPIRTGS
jgi:hypothetical protein